MKALNVSALSVMVMVTLADSSDESKDAVVEGVEARLREIPAKPFER
jgi:hypothetical protein